MQALTCIAGPSGCVDEVNLHVFVRIEPNTNTEADTSCLWLMIVIIGTENEYGSLHKNIGFKSDEKASTCIHVCTSLHADLVGN